MYSATPCTCQRLLFAAVEVLWARAGLLPLERQRGGCTCPAGQHPSTETWREAAGVKQELQKGANSDGALNRLSGKRERGV